MKHTPGPWFYSRASDTIYGHSSEGVAHVIVYEAGNNAQLIVAAPDLLETVKNLLWYITQLEAIVYGPDDTGEHEEVTAALAAIAKATGDMQ
jgi:hypothetical protein